MAQRPASATPTREGTDGDGGLSLYAIGAAIVDGRRLLWRVALVGAGLGAGSAFVVGTRFTTRTTVVAVAGGGGDTRVRGLASQLGLGDLAGLAGGGQTTSPAFVVQLATSPVVLQRLASDSVMVPEVGNAPHAIVDLLEPTDEAVTDPAAAERRQRKVARKLGRLIKVWQIRETGSVRFEVTTEWASLSHALSVGLVRVLNDVNLEIGRRQAEQERRFVEARLEERERLVRDAERRLEQFLRTNRDFRNSASLTFDHDRLQRDVSLQQQLRASLAQSLEDVRIREVRDVAVLSTVEPPLLPLERDSRGTVLRALVGGLVGILLAVAISVWPLLTPGGRDAGGADARRYRDALAAAWPWRRRRRVDG